MAIQVIIFFTQNFNVKKIKSNLVLYAAADKILF